MHRNVPQTCSWWHGSITCSGFAVHRVHCSPRPHQKRCVGFVKVCFKRGLHAFSDMPVLWYEVFVAISVQWQGFKSTLTSSVPFTYNFSTVSDKVAISFSTDNSKDAVRQDLVVCSQYKLSLLSKLVNHLISLL